MEWTNQHDTLFLREVRGSDLFETRKGSPERGKLWDEIATRLNNLTQCKFNVNKRSLRDRLNLLMSKFKAKNKEEERASGISPEIQEIDTLSCVKKRKKLKISLQLVTKTKAFRKRRQQLKKCASRQWKPWEKLKNGWRKQMEWFQQRKAGNVLEMPLDTCKRKQKKRWH